MNKEEAHELRKSYEKMVEHLKEKAAKLTEKYGTDMVEAIFQTISDTLRETEDEDWDDVWKEIGNDIGEITEIVGSMMVATFLKNIFWKYLPNDGIGFD